MRIIITLILTCLSSMLFAAEGTTYCPEPKSFHYNSNNGFLEAPGGWRTIASANSKVIEFVRAEANEYNGNVYSCFYNIKTGKRSIEDDADSFLSYTADDLNASYWKKGSGSIRVCVSNSPQDCPFHQTA